MAACAVNWLVDRYQHSLPAIGSADAFLTAGFFTSGRQFRPMGEAKQVYRHMLWSHRMPYTGFKFWITILLSGQFEAVRIDPVRRERVLSILGDCKRQERSAIKLTTECM